MRVTRNDETLTAEQVQSIERSGLKIMWHDDVAASVDNTKDLEAAKDSTVQHVMQVFGHGSGHAYDTLESSYAPIAKLAKGKRSMCIRDQGERERIKVLPAGTPLYKGMDYFYDKGADVHVSNGSEDASWFEAAPIAYLSSRNLHGGLHAYRTRRDARVLFMDPPNVRKCVEMLRSAGKMREAETLADLTCSSSDVPACMRKYLVLHRWQNSTEIWLTRRTSADGKCTIARGKENLLLWGHEVFDRFVARALCPIMKRLGLDGYFFPEIRTPFTNTGLTSEQVILCDAADTLERNVDDPLDWTQWPAAWLARVPLVRGFVPNSKMTHGNNRNQGFRMIRFYLEHPVDGAHNTALKRVIGGHKRKRKQTLVIATLNVHEFVSINSLDTRQQCMHHAMRFVKEMMIDVACIQECGSVPPNELGRVAAQYGLRVYAQQKPTGMAVVWRDAVPLDGLKFRLYPKTQGRPRGRILFAVHGVTFGSTHLEIGKRYNVVKGPHAIAMALQENQVVRKSQLAALRSDGRDIVLGDFNIEPWMPELAHLRAAYRIPDIDDELVTSVYGGRVDYIGYSFRSKKSVHVLLSAVADYPYSDHLPLIHVIQH